MSLVSFYRLGRRRALEFVLPRLLEKALQRGGRVVVRVGSAERLSCLDDVLWTYKEESFLPHGADTAHAAAEQPIILTNGNGNPNGADVLFLVDGARVVDADSIANYKRVVYILGHADEAEAAAARAMWEQAEGAGHKVLFWFQESSGRWVRQDDPWSAERVAPVESLEVWGEVR